MNPAGSLSFEISQPVSQILVFTNSADGTCDALAHLLKLRDVRFFRWNVDLWRLYETRTIPGSFSLADPTGRTLNLSNPGVFLLWRKPFTDLMSFKDLPLTEADQEQARSQVGQWMQSVVAFMMSQGRIRLIEPYADRRVPKLFQLHEAQHFFDVPQSLFSIGPVAVDFGSMAVAKPLGDPSIGDENIFYTRRVKTDELCRPYPWFVQEALVEGTDITCVHILGHNHFYECDFVRSNEAIDWRTEINCENQSRWHPLRHPRLRQLEEAVSAFMVRLGLHYGRLDFIRRGDRIFFLECNTNGQFGWLDDPGTLALHREFLNAALSPRARVG